MKTLVVYDNEGTIFLSYTGRYTTPIGLQHMEIEVPEDKLLTKIDVSVTPHKPIFKDIPISEIETLRLEQAQANSELVQLIMMMGGA